MTKMSNREEEVGRMQLLLFEGLLDFTAFWNQLIIVLSVLRGANEKYMGQDFPLKLSILSKYPLLNVKTYCIFILIYCTQLYRILY